MVASVEQHERTGSTSGSLTVKPQVEMRYLDLNEMH